MMIVRLYKNNFVGGVHGEISSIENILRKLKENLIKMSDSCMHI